MRRRYQQGSLSKLGSVWIAQWRENGRKRKRTLGRFREMTKAQALTELAAILAPINRTEAPQAAWLFGDFVNRAHLPFYERKWKLSTVMTNRDRIRRELMPEFSARTLGSLSRDELQAFLDCQAGPGLSFSTVDHMRWDLNKFSKWP